MLRKPLKMIDDASKKEKSREYKKASDLDSEIEQLIDDKI